MRHGLFARKFKLMLQDEKYVFAILMVSLSSNISSMSYHMFQNGDLFAICMYALALMYSYTGLTFVIDDD